MSFERAKKHLEAYSLQDKIYVFDESSATVAEAAHALGVDGALIAKTLSFEGNDGRAMLILAAGDARVDNRKFKDTFSKKAKMLTPDQLDALVGHSVGGVCPFGIYDTADVYLDRSLLRFETVYPAVGSANSAVRLTLAELEAASGYISWVDVTKLPELGE